MNIQELIDYMCDNGFIDSLGRKELERVIEENGAQSIEYTIHSDNTDPHRKARYCVFHAYTYTLYFGPRCAGLTCKTSYSTSEKAESAALRKIKQINKG